MLTDPVRIVVGGVGEANDDITQVVEIMETDQDKWAWLLKHLVEFTSSETCAVLLTHCNWDILSHSRIAP